VNDRWPLALLALYSVVHLFVFQALVYSVLKQIEIQIVEDFVYALRTYYNYFNFQRRGYPVDFKKVIMQVARTMW
jgi:hypothetical protein